MKPKVVAVVPARLNSSRFAGKVIFPHRGKPLLSYLLKEIARSKRIGRVVVATDSREVRRALEDAEVEVLMTSSRHRTGSDRAAEAVSKIGGDIILNIQADNFGLKTAVLDRIIDKLIQNRRIEFATIARRIESDAELSDPNVVKVVTGRDGRALWFSRFPLPYLQKTSRGRRVGQFPFYHHIGVYFFRRAALMRFAAWKRTPMEKAESLEQLRILENGHDLTVFKTSMKSVSVDTPRDLKKIDKLYR
ncbi:MAG: 3-deoxy-manno-octulosonate cytidylyltransferase [candidate division Zixibacteria bacterium]|nr:3-deoxy-manno-octulosonate cytidylyltransferase [candidate division Zixibacteria bacterium]